MNRTSRIWMRAASVIGAGDIVVGTGQGTVRAYKSDLGLDEFVVAWLVGIALCDSEDSPCNPWRDPILQECLDRECGQHVSCVRREAIIRFEVWAYGALQNARLAGLL